MVLGSTNYKKRVDKKSKICQSCIKLAFPSAKKCRMCKKINVNVNFKINKNKRNNGGSK